MAELDTSSGGGKKGPGVKKAKKLSTKIDLTPMVDLGFLLITFFIFTTTMSKPKTQSLSMPKDDPTLLDKDKTKIKESTVLTALLSKDHRVYYYEGIGSDAQNPPKVETASLRAAKGGVRQAIISLKKKVADLKLQPGSNILADDQATVIIKPDSNSTYEDVVDMLDEMIINDINIYAIVEIGKEDRNFIAITEQANGVK
jgi:biopolymer transport protein ExbD